MRRLAYAWIKGFGNLDEVGVNFGSPYRYDLQKTDTSKEENNLVYTLIRTPDLSYIDEFFKLDSGEKLANLTAVVGNNASGKSTFLKALRQIFNGQGSVFGYLLIFHETNDVGEIVESKWDSNIALDGHKITNYPQDLQAIQTVFYKPNIDLSIYPVLTEEKDIDVSSDWLFHKSSELKANNRTNISDAEFFRLEEIKRQIIFTQNEELIDRLSTKVPVRAQVSIQTCRIDFSTKLEDSSIRNVPFEFRPIYDVLSEKFFEILNFKISKDQTPYQKEEALKLKGYRIFLFHLLQNLFYHFDTINDNLGAKIEEINTGVLEKINFEEGVYLFLKKQQLFNESPVVNLIHKYKQLNNVGFAGSREFEVNSFFVEVIEISELYEAYEGYIREITPYKSDHVPFFPLFNFDWGNMSSGEQSLFNFYSRMNFAVQRLTEKLEPYMFANMDNDDSPVEIPLLVLIDEGELGFHVQWQKEFISEIIGTLPALFNFDARFFFEGRAPLFEIKSSIQVVLTTHSPIALSDIPKSHVAYLPLDGQIAPNQDTFGANIHSLFKNSFFMGNGLIGEFAKSVITKIIQQLNDFEELSVKEIDNLTRKINLIGEDLVRVKLFKMLAEKKPIEGKERLKEHYRNKLKELDD